MKKLNMIMEKDKNLKYLLISLFILSVIFRSYWGITHGEIYVFFDELLHWNISKSIFWGLGTNFRNDIINYQEILYSILMSISHCIGNTEIQYYIAIGINSVLMSSVIFPVYKMAKCFINDKKVAVLISLIAIIMPEMFYTSKIMQENLYYPLVIWFFYIFIKFILKDQYNYKSLIKLSLYIFIISLCKQMALNLFCGICLYYFIQFIIDKPNRKKCFFGMFSFITVFICLKLIYNYIFVLLLGVNTSSCSENTIKFILKNLFDLHIITKLIYPALCYIILTILYFGVFTIILPVINFKSLNKNQQNLLLLVGSIFITTIGVICLSIIPIENLDQINIRFHYRYFFFLLIPILILFFSMYQDIHSYINYRNLTAFTIFYIMLLKYVNIIPVGSQVDCIPSNYLNRIFNSDMMKNTLYMLIIIGILLCLLLLYNKRIKLLYILIVFYFVFTSSMSLIYDYNESDRIKQSSIIQKEDALKLNEFLSTNKHKQNSVLIISDQAVSDAPFEAYLKYPNYYYTMKADFIHYLTNMKNNTFSKLQLFSFNNYFNDNNIKNPKYIICNEKLNLNGYRFVDIHMKKYFLYSRTRNEIFVKSYILNRYSDMWIGKDSNIILYSKDNMNERNITLKMDSPLQDGMKLKLVDSTGKEQEIVVHSNISEYNVTVNRKEDENYYNINITADTTIVPNQYDTRNLSVRIYDIN